MPLGLITSIIDAIKNGPEGDAPSAITIAGLDPRDPNVIYKGEGFDFNERALQYWPASIQDGIDIGWNFKDLGGASSALAQWSSNNGRTISFDVQLSRYMMPKSSRNGLIENFHAGFEEPGNQNPKDNRPYNVDIKEQIKFLRGFCYPSYVDIEGIVSSVPPPVMILNIPNLGLNETGGDSIYCVMTGCDVTYNLLFRDGTPRRATVSLTLRQIVQTPTGVRFKGFCDTFPSAGVAKYNMYGDEGLDVNAGRGINNINHTGIE